MSEIQRWDHGLGGVLIKSSVGSLVLYTDHLAALAEKDKWPRCNEDIGDGTLCNAEMVDGGEGVGMFCSLCELRETMHEQREQITALNSEWFQKYKERGEQIAALQARIKELEGERDKFFSMTGEAVTLLQEGLAEINRLESENKRLQAEANKNMEELCRLTGQVQQLGGMLSIPTASLAAVSPCYAGHVFQWLSGDSSRCAPEGLRCACGACEADGKGGVR